MPYIDEKRKADVLVNGATNAGELNYLFTYWIGQYILDKDESYQTYNDIIGALEGAKLELYRRRISKYEDRKAVENGDVY